MILRTKDISLTKPLVSLSTAQNKEQDFQAKIFSLFKKPFHLPLILSKAFLTLRKKIPVLFNQAEINVLCNIAVEVQE